MLRENTDGNAHRRKINLDGKVTELNLTVYLQLVSL